MPLVCGSSFVFHTLDPKGESRTNAGKNSLRAVFGSPGRSTSLPGNAIIWASNRIMRTAPHLLSGHSAVGCNRGSGYLKFPKKNCHFSRSAPAISRGEFCCFAPASKQIAPPVKSLAFGNHQAGGGWFLGKKLSQPIRGHFVHLEPRPPKPGIPVL